MSSEGNLPAAPMYVDRQHRRIVVNGWSKRVEFLAQDRMLFGVRRGVNLLIELSTDPSLICAEAWSGDPDHSDGLAVVVDRDGTPLGLAPIPLCSCGERGCSNAGVQLAHAFPAGVVPKLVTFLGDLPDLDVAPVRGETWLGGLDELPERTRETLVAQGIEHRFPK